MTKMINVNVSIRMLTPKVTSPSLRSKESLKIYKCLDLRKMKVNRFQLTLIS